MNGATAEGAAAEPVLAGWSAAEDLRGRPLLSLVSAADQARVREALAGQSLDTLAGALGSSPSTSAEHGLAA